LGGGSDGKLEDDVMKSKKDELSILGPSRQEPIRPAPRPSAEPPTEIPTTLRGTAAPRAGPPREGWYVDEDRSRRHELFRTLLQEWQRSREPETDGVRAYVEQHLKAALPRGWIANFRIAREAQHLPNAEITSLHYEWKIFREGEDPDQDFEYYLAYLNVRNQLVLLYGNGSVGVGGPQDFWEQSINIPLVNLGLVLPFVFARPHEFSPNHMDLT
jgi:hypothetical protein